MLLWEKRVALKGPGNDCDCTILSLPHHINLFNVPTVL